MDDRLLAFGVSVAVVVIPGPDMALVARNVDAASPRCIRRRRRERRVGARVALERT